MNRSELEHWKNARKLLDEVLLNPGPEALSAALIVAQEQGCNTELQKLIAALDTQSVLDAPLDDAIRQMAAPGLRHGALSQRVFGRWTLGEEIGRGGMSVVYHAQRTGDGFEQQAALKILSLTFASQAMTDSFLRERQILSELQHPGIARLIDGGVTPEGSPFLVMEYVKGERIDRWCEQHQTDIRGIVTLVQNLAKAVAYAQHHLVIHRDINASNVLVNEHDQPVLIDFGIAGLMGRDGGKTLHAFTPTFAAPEQITGTSSTTATDVYAMGQLLGSLLAGKVIDKDLCLLIDVATAQDPEQRYANARNLAEDLQAWLDKRPMRARPPTLRYRLTRFVSRNRWGVAAAMLLVISLLVGLVMSVTQARIAAYERDIARAETARANEVTGFLKSLFLASDPDNATGEEVTARELLDQGAYQIHSSFKGATALKIEMLVLLGDLYRELDETAAAEPLLGEAVELAESLGDAPLLAGSLSAMANLKMSAQEHEQALAIARRAEVLLTGMGDVPGQQHSTLLQPILFSLAELGRLDEAVSLGRKALSSARKDPDLPASVLYHYLYDLANVLSINELDAEAEPLLLEALNLGADAVNEPTVQIALLYSLSSKAGDKGDIDASLSYLKQANELVDQIYPPNHSVRARGLSNLGNALNRAGRYPEAETALLSALDIYDTIYGDEANPRVAAAHNNLGRSLQLQEKLEEAAGQIGLARDMAGKIFGTEDPRYAIVTGNFADLQRQLGRYAVADELLLDNLELRRSVFGQEHRQVGNGLALLCSLRLDQMRYVEALEYCDESLALFDRIGVESPVILTTVRTRRARALAGMGREQDALAEFAGLLVILDSEETDVGRGELDLLFAYSHLLIKRSDPKANVVVQKAIDAHTRLLGEDHPGTQKLRAMMQALDVDSG